MQCLCRRRILLLLVCLFVLTPPECFAQTQNQAAVLRGEGAFLRGAGSYNLNTAKATSINVDTVIRWKKEMRDDAARNRDLQARNAAGKKMRIEEVKKLQQDRERKLRIDPGATDIVTGDALNVLLYDLTDPDIKSSDWSSKIVELPKGMSVKDMIFRFTPLSGSSDTSKALSRGVIALSLLDITGDKWPTVMKQDALKSERLAYESAYSKLRDQLLNDNLKLETLVELDGTLEALKKKANKEIPKDRGFRDEAIKFVEDLKNASRFFDAKTVDYAKEILVDTKDNDAKSVAELVGFMLKYRLQFASAERSATGRPLYGQLYEVMQQQANAFGIKPGPLPTVPEDTDQRPFFNRKNLDGWAGLQNLWSVKDGAIVGSTLPDGISFNSCLCSNREYGDFEMTCKIKLIGPAEANSGIQIRSTLIDATKFLVHGTQCDVGQGYWGSLWGEGTGMLRQADKAVVNAALKVGDFNEMYIRCIGRQVVIKLNGKTTVDELFPSIPTRGIIGWSLHSGKGCGVIFKDIEFKELPAGK